MKTRRRWFSNPRKFVPVMGDLVFTPAMDQRLAGGPFDYAPIFQGDWDGTGTGDNVSLGRGAQLANPFGVFYANVDPEQGAFTMWITPEWDGGDAVDDFLAYANVDFYLAKTTTGYIQFRAGVGSTVQVDISAGGLNWVAGDTHLIICRWNANNPIDGTNYVCLTLDNASTFGVTSSFTPLEPDATLYVGSVNGLGAANCIIAGDTVLRRVIYDGTYGVDVGNGNETNLIYNAGAGTDPCLILGAFDVCRALPTDQVSAALQNTGEAWSMPHADSLPDVSFMSDGGYLCEPWVVEFNATTTNINCGSNAALDNLFRQPSGKGEATIEAWIRADGWGESIYGGRIVGKDDGWHITTYSDSNYGLEARVRAATDAIVACGIDDFVPDGKFHHVVMYFQELADGGDGDIYLAIDGRWVTTYTLRITQVGAITDDSADNLHIGNHSAGVYTFDGGIGWVAIWSDDHYVHGTDFIPPRTAPAPGGNLVESWHHDEGTGVTTTAQVNVGAPPGGCNGTIAAGTWSAPWEFEGTPVIPQSLEFDGAATSINFGSGAAIDNLPDSVTTAGLMTLEAWVCADTQGEGDQGRIFHKREPGATGYEFYMGANGRLTGIIFCAGAPSYFTGSAPTDFPLGTWHHVAMVYDDTGATFGTRVFWLFVDGIHVATSGVANGAIVQDAAVNLYVGNNNLGASTWGGRIGWLRVSNSIRYAANFIPAGRTNPPANDGTAQLLINMDDGAGLVATDTSGNAYHGAITMGAGRWWNTPDMESEEPGARVFGWGYNLGSDGANDGMTVIEDAQVIAEMDYVIRTTIAPGNSGRAQPKLRIRDNIGAAQIGADFDLPALVGQHTGANNSATLIAAGGEFTQQLVGWEVYNITDGSSTTSTAVSGDKTTITGVLAGGTDNDWDTNDWYYIRPPNNRSYCQHPHSTESIFVFRTPAACTSIDVKIMNAAGEGVLGIQQCEVYESLIDNGDMEAAFVGVPPIPPGWTNAGLDAGDTQESSTGGGVIHSGADALQFNVGATGIENLYDAPAGTPGNFYAIMCWAYADGRIYGAANREVFQYTAATPMSIIQSGAAVWEYLVAVTRQVHATTLLIQLFGRDVQHYVDDVACIHMNNVNLAITPANYANSLEGPGVRIDGRDAGVFPVPIGYLTPTHGIIEWAWVPRHADADVADFGWAQPRLLYVTSGGADYIDLFWNAANQLRLEFSVGAVVSNNTWATGGFFVPGTQYKLKLRWWSSRMILYVNNAPMLIVNAPINFVAPFTFARWGTNGIDTMHADCAIGPP